MKKSLRYILTAVLAAALVFAAFGLVACGSKSDIKELRVENARISFMRGDMFELGEDFTVYAVYKDGSEVNVTDQVTVRQESGMDMGVPGNYQITVSYGGKKVIYTVYVNDAEDVLRKVELDSSAVKKQYNLGDSVALDGLVLHLTYENAQGVLFPVTTSSLKDFNVEIKGEDGTVIDNMFTALGSFTVTVSQGNVKASFSVRVDGVDTSSVQGALAVGGFYREKVASGSITVTGARNVEDMRLSDYYTYTFGDNYTYINDTRDETYVEEKPDGTKETYTKSHTEEYHCAIDAEGFFVVYVDDGTIKTSNRNNADMMHGAPVLLWYGDTTEYGIENALLNLYNHALKCSNDDLKETVDEPNKKYTFTFSGLELRSNSYDYYETTVSFTLSEEYTIASASFRQDYYEYNGSWADQPDYPGPTYITDPTTGKTRPASAVSYRSEVSVTQTTGEREAQNEYDRDMFRISSYKLTYNGVDLGDNGTLPCEAGQIYTLRMTDVLPATADFAQDTVLFDFDGNIGGGDTWLSNQHFTLTRDGATISLTVRHGGVWKLTIKTARTVKTLTIDVKGEAPKEMQPKLWNSAGNSFYTGDNKTVAVNGEIYFYGAVEAYADPSQNYRILTENAQYVTVEKTVKNGVDCFKFSASQAGTYQVLVTSESSPLTNWTFTFTVSEMPDYGELLHGKYTVQDQAGYIYELTFSSDGDAGESGAVTVTKTPTLADNTPLPDKAESQTLSYVVSDGDIALTPVSGTNLGILLEVNEKNELVLVDPRDNMYTLSRVSE